MWECISWIPGFNGKREEIRMIFSGGVMCEKLPFFHVLNPAVVRKGTFLHNFFFFEYRFWSQVGASGVVNLSVMCFSQPRGGQKRHFFAQFFFLRMYGVKNYKFFSAAQWHIKGSVFLIQTFFSGILNFLFFCTITPITGYLGVYFMAQWHIKVPGVQTFLNGKSVFHGSQRRNKNDFFWRCHVWKITIFSQPRGGQKRHFFAQFFFLWISILITGRCIWGGLFEFFENLWWKKW